MSRAKIRTGVLAGLAILLSGCFGKPPPDRQYYVLEYVPEPSRQRLAHGPWPATLLVRNFEVGEAYYRPEIVYRLSAHEIKYYWYNLWAVRPEHVVTDMARKHLAQVRFFRNLQNQYEEKAPDYELRGRVIALEEFDHQRTRFAHLELRLDLVRLRDNQTLWGQDLNLRKQVFGTDPVLVVRGLSDLLEIAMNQSIAGMDSVLARETFPTGTDSLQHGPIPGVRSGPESPGDHPRSDDNDAQPRPLPSGSGPRRRQ